MPTDENAIPTAGTSSSGHQQDALQLGPRKKARSTDPLVHHGRHFGRSIHALCNMHALINNGIIRLGERAEDPEEEEQKEQKVFCALLKSVPGLEERLMGANSEEDIQSIAAMLQKGASSARSDDTKSLKSAIIDWITPPGEPLIPPISRNAKSGRGFNHEVTGALLCPAGLNWNDVEIKEKLRTGELSVPGDQWPILLFSSYMYDDNDPSKGLLRSPILVKTFKHIFTSPSSVEREAKATRSGNARIHGMTGVTRGSIAYAATQARFALSASSVFNRNDTITDSERFYNSILEYLEDPDEADDVSHLIAWWNRQVFPNYVPNSRPVSRNSALARIKAKRAAAKQAALGNVDVNTS
ncbi:hypothetical protein HYPSUDRAFT_142490 [Hypholoma sublateritium FD-334 SS-4]|uniref:Uncharacterized protein n=1 Tax=Hypholoma sublateritium (strain FD-334 SS-4) TaxID=945553 RepID=A0A0D2PK04_HYPSF|nr:hypothetical protein HYPSUDRAFT_149722 [Hypholoma sublateritium FD-334 SS-4]KJA20295.1 hypothetical protein HYPSUDRAFT_142490 [Hypholoma sublateritium FD-334 SS-4]